MKRLELKSSGVRFGESNTIEFSLNRAPTTAEHLWLNDSVKQSLAAFYELPEGDLTPKEKAARDGVLTDIEQHNMERFNGTD